MRFFLLMMAGFSFASFSAQASEEDGLKTVPLSQCLDVRTAPFVEMGFGYLGGSYRAKGDVFTDKTTPLYHTLVNGTSRQVFVPPGDFGRGSLRGASFRFTGGWNFVPRHMRVGLGFVLGCALTTSQLKGQGIYAMENTNATSPAEKFSYIQGPQVKVRDPFYFYAAERLGLVTGRTFLFTKLGYSLHRISIEVASDFPGKMSRSVSCLLAGAGIDFNITPSISLGLEGNCHISRKTRYKFLLGNGNFVQISTRTIFSEFLFTVKYVIQALRR